MPEQQLVEIAKALGGDPKVLVMDEPTSALGRREVEHLLRMVTLLRRQGVGVVYISHRLEEVLTLADRITVLRDGESVGTHAASEVDRDDLIRIMVGRDLERVFPDRTGAIGDVAFEARRVTNLERGVRDVSLSVRRGEIVGLAGLVGSGRTELAEVLFGLTPARSGEIRVRGTPTPIKSPADAIRSGIGYLPEDRRRHGVVPEMSIAANASLANLPAVSRRGLVDRAAERASAGRYVEQFRIKAPDVSAAVETLSGGNQQKVALARWLSIDPSVLILDEPTQGVDVGAKADIHALMRTLAAGGLAILMISSELEEILGMSDRIAVMNRGTIAGVIERADATPERVLALALN
jgi:rhamnose transport system ATP-binding protein